MLPDQLMQMLVLGFRQVQVADMEPSAKPVMQWWGSGGKAGLAVNGHAGEVLVDGLGGQAQMAPCTSLAPALPFLEAPGFCTVFPVLPRGGQARSFPGAPLPQRSTPHTRGLVSSPGPLHTKKSTRYTWRGSVKLA